MAENVFGSLQKYGENWQKVAERNFNADEIKAVRSNSVVESQYGKSVCFFLAGGGQSYIPLSKQGNDAPLGSSIDMTAAKLVTLHREGDGDIVRVEL